MGNRLRAGIPSRYVTSQLGQLSLASLLGRLIEYQLRDAVLGKLVTPIVPLSPKKRNRNSRGKVGNFSFVWWQVTLCDRIWHVSSRSGEAG